MAAQCHAEGIPEFVVADVIHQVADEKEAASARAVEILGRDRVADGRRIEPGAVVCDMKVQGIGQAFGAYFDRARRVLAVAVQDGIGQRFGERDPQSESNTGRSIPAREAVARDQLHRLLDERHIAGDPQGDLDGHAALVRAIGTADAEA